MLPELFLERMKNLFDEKEYEEFIGSFDTGDERHHALRLNRMKAWDEDKVLESLVHYSSKDKAPKDNFQNVPWEETGRYYDETLSPGKHPYHEAGLYYIQEPSAMAPVHYLDPQPGEHILDLCAAPGGKSTQIAGKLKGTGLLVTNEINRDRARILSLNIERMGIKNALVLSEDSGHLSEVFEGYFDRILVDAPCSGEGMFRKNEAALTEWSPENVRLCAERQFEILDNASKMLRPGGRMVYSTCTFSPEENEETVFKFLLTHRDYHVLDVQLAEGLECGRKEWVDTGKCLEVYGRAISDEELDGLLREVSKSVRLWPFRVRGEGHFLCVLKRDGEEVQRGGGGYIPGGRFERAKKDASRLFISFAKENLTEAQIEIPGRQDFDCEAKAVTENLLSFGEQIYLAPADMPSIRGLKVLRPGLHLGTVKKDRFEPSHALALALGAENVVLCVNLESGSERIRQYLNGQTIRLSESEQGSLKGEKGWCLITCDGYSIGWAKLAAGMLKNHYPKGLRINY